MKDNKICPVCNKSEFASISISSNSCSCHDIIADRKFDARLRLCINCGVVSVSNYNLSQIKTWRNK